VLQLVHVQRLHRHHEIPHRPREPQPLGPDGLDVLGPLVDQGDVVSRPRHHAADNAADGPRSENADALDHRSGLPARPPF
jgi:hypothetical protein